MEILWNLDPKSRVFASKSRVFALLGAKALDFGAKALDFFDSPAKDLVKFQVGWVLSWMGAVPLESCGACVVGARPKQRQAAA